jgi:hypothetical protein
MVNPTENYARVVSNIVKKFGFEKLTGFLNYKTGPNLTGKCVAGLEHFEIPK